MAKAKKRAPSAEVMTRAREIAEERTERLRAENWARKVQIFGSEKHAQEIVDHAHRIAAEAPPFTAEQLSHLHSLMGPAREKLAEQREADLEQAEAEVKERRARKSVREQLVEYTTEEGK